MKRVMNRSTLWPAGETRLHVYLLPELHLDVDLARLVSACRSVTAAYPYITPVHDQWLHATVQMVTGRPADAVDDATRDRLAACLQAELADLPPFTVTAGSPIAGLGGVLLDLDQDLPGEHFHELYTRTRRAISTSLGAGAVDSVTLPPHVSVGYANADGDSGEVQSRLRRTVRPSHARMSVREVHLVDVVQDVARCEYRWRPVARVPLGSAVSATVTVP